MRNHQHELAISVFASTDVGRCRAGNEDSFLIAELTDKSCEPRPQHKSSSGAIALMVVADGMGGAAAGEVASRLAVNSLRGSVSELPDDCSCEMRLRRAVELANRQVWEEAQRRPEQRGMGTTLTAALIWDGHLCVAQVGDSRAYLIRDRRITQLTRDQTLVQSLIDAGILTAEEALRFPNRNVILQAVGAEPEVQVALTKVTLRQGDYLLLCSDGLSNKIAELEMRFAIENTATPEDACRLLVDWANARGGEDNITVLIARFDGDGLRAAEEEDQRREVKLAA